MGNNTLQEDGDDGNDVDEELMNKLRRANKKSKQTVAIEMMKLIKGTNINSN